MSPLENKDLNRVSSSANKGFQDLETFVRGGGHPFQVFTALFALEIVRTPASHKKINCYPSRHYSHWKLYTLLRVKKVEHRSLPCFPSRRIRTGNCSRTSHRKIWYMDCPATPHKSPDKGHCGDRIYPILARHNDRAQHTPVRFCGFCSEPSRPYPFSCNSLSTIHIYRRTRIWGE